MSFARTLLPLLAIGAMLSAFAPEALARPGTPNEVSVEACAGWYGIPPANLGRPALCVKFQNTATEQVSFDVDITSDGAAGRPPDSRLGCLIPAQPSIAYQCTAGHNLGGISATTRAAASSWVPWLDAFSVLPLSWGVSASPTIRREMERLYEADPKWQGFYVSELEWDTNYCFRIRARDTSDTVSERWSNWDCERTRQAPPLPVAPEVTIEFSELRGTIAASWRKGERIGYYTVEAGASRNDLGPEVARLVPAAAREPSTDTRYTDTSVELTVPYGLAKAMEGEAYLVRVCAHNYSGKTCSDWASSLGAQPPRSFQRAAVVESAPIAGSAPASSVVAEPVEAGGIANARAATGCRAGLVHRSARIDDHVCVTPASKRRIGVDNAEGLLLRDPNGAYGPDSCRAGYVWREAFAGDTVCVLPSRRSEVREENRRAAENRAPANATEEKKIWRRGAVVTPQ